MERDQATEEKVRERIANQMNDEEKCRRSDFTVYTDSPAMVLEQIDSLIGILKNKTKV